MREVAFAKQKTEGEKMKSYLYEEYIVFGDP